jgi:uncharacterized membrane protein (DUF4010 family)
MLTSPDTQLLGRFAIALALGLLLGLERGWEYRQLPEGGRVAGIRTFGLVSLLGAVAVQFDQPTHELFLSASIIGVALLMGLGFWRESEIEKDVSVTTGIAALLAFGLGAMAGAGRLAVAASATIVITLILGFRTELHRLVFHIEHQELTATLRLLLISVVMLPVLPNRGFGPWTSFNPYQIWWMVVMIAALSYVGYFAIKLLGEHRGVLVTGLLGGMMSSTAVTLTLAPAAKESDQMQEIVAAAVISASAIMFPRMLVIAVIVAPRLVESLALPLVAATVTSLAGASWFAWQSRQVVLSNSRQELATRNPLDLWFASKFGLLLALIMILSRAAKGLLGNRGLLALSGISGLVDVDAITLSVSSMFNQGQMKSSVAAIAILLSAAVNTLVKPSLMMVIAGVRASIRVWLVLLAALAAGWLAYWLELST